MWSVLQGSWWVNRGSAHEMWCHACADLLVFLMTYRLPRRQVPEGMRSWQWRHLEEAEGAFMILKGGSTLGVVGRVDGGCVGAGPVEERGGSGPGWGGGVGSAA